VDLVASAPVLEPVLEAPAAWMPERARMLAARVALRLALAQASEALEG
jgi:hypothetical protein